LEKVARCAEMRRLRYFLLANLAYFPRLTVDHHVLNFNLIINLHQFKHVIMVFDEIRLSASNRVD